MNNADPSTFLIRFLSCAFLVIAAACMLIVQYIVLLLAFNSPPRTAELLFDIWPQVVVGFCAMFAFCIIGANCVGKFCVKHPIVGGLVGIIILLVGVLFGSASSLILSKTLGIYDFVVKPLFWIMLFGTVPAFIIGFIGSLVTKRIINNPNNAIHRMATRVMPPAWVRSSPGRSHATGSHR